MLTAVVAQSSYREIEMPGVETCKADKMCKADKTEVVSDEEFTKQEPLARGE